jgi:hypothetical protein
MHRRSNALTIFVHEPIEFKRLAAFTGLVVRRRRT